MRGERLRPEITKSGTLFNNAVDRGDRGKGGGLQFVSGSKE